MARGGEGDIPGNNLGQGFTSPSTCTHVLGAYGTPTGSRGGAADGRQRLRPVPRIRQRLRVVRADFMAAFKDIH